MSNPWTARLPREANIGQSRSKHDMRLALFNYPLEGWADAVVMNHLMGQAVVLQLGEFCQISYQPLAEVFRAILPVETHHAELAQEGLQSLLHAGNRSVLQDSIDYWAPRVAASFGTEASEKFAGLRAMGLRHTPNETLRQYWQRDAGQALNALGLRLPERL